MFSLSLVVTSVNILVFILHIHISGPLIASVCSLIKFVYLRVIFMIKSHKEKIIFSLMLTIFFPLYFYDEHSFDATTPMCIATSIMSKSTRQLVTMPEILSKTKCYIPHTVAILLPFHHEIVCQAFTAFVIH